MQAFWQFMLGLVGLVIGLVFWSFVLRWVLGIYYLSGKLDKVLKELSEIKRRIGDQAGEQSSGPVLEQRDVQLPVWMGVEAVEQSSSQPEEAIAQDDDEKPDEPTQCMRCGQTIPAESSNCPACGWTWRPVSNENGES